MGRQPVGVYDHSQHALPEFLFHYFDRLFGLALLFLLLSSLLSQVYGILLSKPDDTLYHTYNVMIFYNFAFVSPQA